MNTSEVLVSKEAAKYIAEYILSHNMINAYIRLGVKGSGCNGLSYHIEFESDNIKDKDIVYDQLGVRLVIDNKSIKYLNGSTLDWKKSLMSTGFKINNPQETSRCGCGNSFST